jgi:hypothetical protein
MAGARVRETDTEPIAHAPIVPPTNPFASNVSSFGVPSGVRGVPSGGGLSMFGQWGRSNSSDNTSTPSIGSTTATSANASSLIPNSNAQPATEEQLAQGRADAAERAAEADAGYSGGPVTAGSTGTVDSNGNVTTPIVDMNTGETVSDNASVVDEIVNTGLRDTSSGPVDDSTNGDKNSFDLQADEMWQQMQDEYGTGLQNTLQGTYADEAVMGRRAAEMNALGGGSGYGGSFNAAMAQTALGGEQLRANARQKAMEGHLNMEGAYLERLMSRAQSEDDQDFQAYLQALVDSNAMEREKLQYQAQADAMEAQTKADEGSLSHRAGDWIEDGAAAVGNAVKSGWNSFFG